MFIPIVAILLMVTIVGIPLSFFLLSLYEIALYSSKIILSVYISPFVQNRWNGSNTQAFWLFLLTLILLTGLGAIPIVGMILGFLTVSLRSVPLVFAQVKPKKVGKKGILLETFEKVKIDKVAKFVLKVNG